MNFRDTTIKHLFGRISGRKRLLTLLCLLLTWGCRDNVNDDSVPFSITEIISVNSEGLLGNYASSGNASISTGGRYIAFMAKGEDLASGGSNTITQIFVRDTLLGTTELVSRESGINGTPATTNCDSPKISPDGRWVAFVSEATNLASGLSSSKFRIFLRDRQSHNLHWISRAYHETDPNLGDDPDKATTAPSLCINADGNIRIAFASDTADMISVDTNGARDVFYRDFFIETEALGATVLVSRQGGETGTQTSSASVSDYPDISGNGEYVAFESDSKNLDPTPGIGTFDTPRIYRRNLTTTYATDPFSLKSGEWNSTTNPNQNGTAPSISYDGNVVAFESTVDLHEPTISDLGLDIYVRDESNGQYKTILASKTFQELPVIANCSNPSISGDGNKITFQSDSTHFLNTDLNEATDIFLHDRYVQSTYRVSVGTYGVEANAESTNATLSPNGQFVSFLSPASNLTFQLDLNGQEETFLRGPLP